MLKLYGHPLSSYTQKALIALYDLGEPFQFEMVSPDNEAGAALSRVWPYGKFPVLVDGDVVVPEATLIIEHLSERAGGGLVPSNPGERREARLIDRVIDNYVATPQQKLVTDQFRAEGEHDPAGLADARALIDTSYAWLETRLAGRIWAAGETFTLADCGAAPMLFYADWFQPIGEGRPTLAAYVKRLRARPSVKRAFDEARPYRHMVPGGIPAHIQ